MEAPGLLHAESRGQVSRREQSSEETSRQAGECGDQQGGQRQGQQLSWGLRLEHEALPLLLQGPDIFCHSQFLLLIIVQLLGEGEDLWKGRGSAGSEEQAELCSLLCDPRPFTLPL